MGKRDPQTWKTLPNPQIEMVEGHRLDPDEHVIRPEDREWNIRIVEHFGAPVRSVDNRFHPEPFSREIELGFIGARIMLPEP